MKIHTEKIKPHRKHEYSSGNYIIMSFIKSSVTIVYIKEEFESIREEFEYTN